MKRRQVIVLATVVLLLIGCGKQQTPPAQSTAPSLYPTLSKEAVDKQIASLKGKVVLVNFWATWCLPCREEIPGLVELQANHGSNGLQIVGLSLDLEPSELAAFVRKSGINYPVYLIHEDVANAWGAEYLPTSFLLDRQGKKIWYTEKNASREDFEKQIKPLLTPPPPSAPSS